MLWPKCFALKVGPQNSFVAVGVTKITKVRKGRCCLVGIRR